jgi:acyl carrier protein
MTEADIYPVLTEIFREVFMRGNLTLEPELTGKDVDGWDSFKQIEIVMLVEERFGIHLTTRDLDALQNVGDLVCVIASRAAK